MSDEKPRPNISISQSATDSENVTQIGYQEGDVTIDQSRTDSSVHIDGDVNAAVANIGSGSQTVHGDVVGRDQIESAPLDLDALFVRLQEWVAEQDEVDQVDAQELVQDLRVEIDKGDEADQTGVHRLLRNIGRMSKEIGLVITKTLINPAAGVAEVIRLVAEKAQAEFGE